MVSRAFDGRRRIGYYDGSYCDCRACGNRNTWTIRIRGTWLDILPPSGQHITPSAYSCALLVASALASLGCGITPPDYAFFGAESRAPCVLVCAVGVGSMGIRRLSPFTFHLLPVYYLLITITPNVPIAEAGVRGAWAIALFGSVNAAFAGVLLWGINTLLPCLVCFFLRKNVKRLDR